MEPRIEGPSYLRSEGEGDDLKMVYCRKEDASMTEFAITAMHPLDRHEFGLMIAVTEVTNWPEKWQLSDAMKALKQYMGNHPDGNFCDNDDCEHPDAS